MSNPTLTLDRAVDFIRSLCELLPDTAIILGSGLGGLSEKIQSIVEVDFGDIPGFARSTAGGHRGKLILGKLGERPIVAMAGRLHRYEGHSNDAVAFPVRVMNALGATRLIVSNAAGGVNPQLAVGDIVVIRDHINMMGGATPFGSDSRCPTLTRRAEVYDSAMSQIAIETAIQNNFRAVQGTYLATLGPTYETRSEYRMMRRIGADVAGMSTVPEVLAAATIGMKVLGLSMVTNVANPDQAIKADHQEVLAAGQAAAVKMEAIVRAVLDAQ